MEPLIAHGEFPSVLYRVFADEYWARQFVEHGRMRLSRVEYFAAVEDPLRADPTEGKAHRQIPGDVYKVTLDQNGELIGVHTEPGYVHWRSEFLNPVYIMCFSCPPDGDEEQLPWKFGRFAARIDNPQRFAQDITNWLTQEGVLRGTPVVECRRVLYDKGEPGEDEPAHSERMRLNFSQKPRDFASEYEYRFAVVASPRDDPEGVLGTHHPIDLGRPLEYARLLPPRVEATGAA